MSPSTPRLSATGPVPLYQRALALIALVATTPLLALSVLFIRATSPGPALFRQRRIGQNGREIVIVKLRTMRHSSTITTTATTAADPRVTTIGRWLRRLKIDELPQLWCVVRGDMAVIGPRPDVDTVINALPAEDRAELLRHQPGITGIASLYFRNEEVLLDRVTDPEAFSAGPLIQAKAILNAAYALHSSWRDDLQLVWLTVRDDRNALDALVERLAPGYRDTPPFQLLSAATTQST